MQHGAEPCRTVDIGQLIELYRADVAAVLNDTKPAGWSSAKPGAGWELQQAASH